MNFSASSETSLKGRGEYLSVMLSCGGRGRYGPVRSTRYTSGSGKESVYVKPEKMASEDEASENEVKLDPALGEPDTCHPCKSLSTTGIVLKLSELTLGDPQVDLNVIYSCGLAGIAQYGYDCSLRTGAGDAGRSTHRFGALLPDPAALGGAIFSGGHCLVSMHTDRPTFSRPYLSIVLARSKLTYRGSTNCVDRAQR